MDVVLGRLWYQCATSVRRLGALAACGLTIASCASSGTGPNAGPAVSKPVVAASGTCGTSAAPPAYKHVIWIWMENHSYSQIIGNSSQAPYLASLARECGVAANYHSLSHPSLPNYAGATSGLAVSRLTEFDSDCDPSATCSTPAPSIFGQGETWKAYAESMPSDCYQSDSGEYAVRHNPPPYFSGLAGCGTHDVPYSQLSADLNAGALPAFSFITPNLIDDMHDGTISDGDTWLSRNLPVILGSREYTSGTTVVFITWDEGDGGSTGESCARDTADSSCHVATVVISPSTPAGARSSVLFNHYSLLGTAEQLLGLPFLGEASAYPTMTKAFRL